MYIAILGYLNTILSAKDIVVAAMSIFPARKGGIDRTFPIGSPVILNPSTRSLVPWLIIHLPNSLGPCSLNLLIRKAFTSPESISLELQNLILLVYPLFSPVFDDHRIVDNQQVLQGHLALLIDNRHHPFNSVHVLAIMILVIITHRKSLCILKIDRKTTTELFHMLSSGLG